jgi:hypothetical protein
MNYSILKNCCKSPILAMGAAKGVAKKEKFDPLLTFR